MPCNSVVLDLWHFTRGSSFQLIKTQLSSSPSFCTGQNYDLLKFFRKMQSAGYSWNSRGRTFPLRPSSQAYFKYRVRFPNTSHKGLKNFVTLCCRQVPWSINYPVFCITTEVFHLRPNHISWRSVEICLLFSNVFSEGRSFREKKKKKQIKKTMKNSNS